MVQCAGISGLSRISGMRDSRWSRIAHPFAAVGIRHADWGPYQPIVCAAVRRMVLGPGSQERYPRLLRIHLLPGGLVSLGAQGTRRRPP